MATNLTQIAKFRIVLVLGALGFRDRKETDVLQLIYSVRSDGETIEILEDEDDDKHEDDTSTSEFRFNPYRVDLDLPPLC